MIDAIIFDSDGTVFMTLERQYNWLKYWAEFNKITFGFAGVDDFRPVYNHLIREKGVQGMYDELKLPCDMSNHDHPVWIAFNKYNQEHPAEIVPGMDKAIKQIWKMGSLSKNPEYNQRVRLALNTTNSWKGLYNDYERYGLVNFFDSFVTAETLKEYDGSGNSKAMNKPSKVSVALSVLLLGAKQEATMFIGDTLTDLQACTNVSAYGNYRKANLITVGVSWGFDGKEALKMGVNTETGTEYFRHIVDTPKELTALVKEYVRS